METILFLIIVFAIARVPRSIVRSLRRIPKTRRHEPRREPPKPPRVDSYKAFLYEQLDYVSGMIADEEDPAKTLRWMKEKQRIIKELNK